MESTRSTLQKRPKATYSVRDFVIHRTLGTGSFGRIHLGNIAVSHRVWTVQWLIFWSVVDIQESEDESNSERPEEPFLDTCI